MAVILEIRDDLARTAAKRAEERGLLLNDYVELAIETQLAREPNPPFILNWTGHDGKLDPAVDPAILTDRDKLYAFLEQNP
ncbi:MAG: hypothetical protein NTZ56_01670 [Acidobacteria bacterium]|nr:hypothetical protein [Acidobacteriota bacterium]